MRGPNLQKLKPTNTYKYVLRVYKAKSAISECLQNFRLRSVTLSKISGWGQWPSPKFQAAFSDFLQNFGLRSVTLSNISHYGQSPSPKFQAAVCDPFQIVDCDQWPPSNFSSYDQWPSELSFRGKMETRLRSRVQLFSSVATVAARHFIAPDWLLEHQALNNCFSSINLPALESLSVLSPTKFISIRGHLKVKLYSSLIMLLTIFILFAIFTTSRSVTYFTLTTSLVYFCQKKPFNRKMLENVYIFPFLSKFKMSVKIL